MQRLRKIVKSILKNSIIVSYKMCIKIFPVNKKIILFESNLGRNYTGNPKAIYEEIIKQGLDHTYRCYFALENMKTPIPGNVRKVKKNRFLYHYILAVAGVWVCDTRLPKHIVKRSECSYIQTWHGTPLKKLALDMDQVYMAGEEDIVTYKKNFYENAQTWDYLISQNTFSSKIFRRAFAFQKEILEIGYPRNDILFHKNNDDDIKALKLQLDLPLDKRIILYAPTWRDNEFHGNGKYKFSSPLDFSKLQKELGEDTVMIVKYHYLVMDQIDWTPYKDFIYSYDLNYDISLLYLVSDLLITDYSSVMFDYSILNRPMIFYCYDLDLYKDSLRGFYFDFLDEAPGPVVLTSEDLIEQLKNTRAYRYRDWMTSTLYETYREKYLAFQQKYNHADDGSASGQIVNLIEVRMKED